MAQNSPASTEPALPQLRVPAEVLPAPGLQRGQAFGATDSGGCFKGAQGNLGPAELLLPGQRQGRDRGEGGWGGQPGGASGARGKMGVPVSLTMGRPAVGTEQATPPQNGEPETDMGGVVGGDSQGGGLMAKVTGSRCSWEDSTAVGAGAVGTVMERPFLR